MIKLIKNECRWLNFGHAPKLIEKSAMFLVVIIVISTSYGMAQKPDFITFDGKVINNLRPVLVLQQEDEWTLNVEFTSTQSVEKEWWSCIPNKLGSRLRLWTTDGSEIHATNKQVEAASQQLKQISMSDLHAQIFQHHHPITIFHLHIHSGGLTPTINFQLDNYFPIQINCVYVLELTPLLYEAKIDASKLKNFNDYQTKANLVEFAPFIVRLETNGNAVALAKLPWHKNN